MYIFTDPNIETNAWQMKFPLENPPYNEFHVFMSYVDKFPLIKKKRKE